jgi:hypothetical protein
MMRLRRASVIVVLSLLASTATAYAECAWVLWVHETRTNVAEQKTSEHWDTAEASINEAGCDSKLKGQIARIQRTLEDGTAKTSKDEEMYFKIIDGRTVSLYFYRKAGSSDAPPSRTQTITHVCLPDTVDPRGPKGK